MVKGISRELFYGTRERAGLVQCLTVFGSGTINVNTAPAAVLRALSAEMTDEAVKRFDEYRREAKNDLADPAWHSRIPGVTGLNIPQGLITTRSDTFRITAVGLHGRMMERIIGIVKRDTSGKKVKLLSWKVE